MSGGRISYPPGGGSGSSPLTTKGDIYTYTTVDARLPVGNDGEVLSADSGETTGLKWIAAGGTGTVTNVSVVTTNGISGSVANSTTTPAITLTLGAITPTSINSVVLSGASTPTLAVTGTSTVSGTNTGDQTITLTGDITGSGTGSFATTYAGIVPLNKGGTAAALADPGADRIMFWDDSAGVVDWLTAGTGLSISGTTLTATGSGGTVTTVSVVSANGLAGSVANPTTTPAITLSTTITGLLKGDGTSISAATAGTDYVTASSTNTFTNKTYDTAGTGNSFSINGLAATANTGTGSVVRATSPTLVTPDLGTPSSATLTNAIGLPVSSGISGLGTGVATFLATPSSANLASAVTDETGSGPLVFGTSPTLTTPRIGTIADTSGNNVATFTSPSMGVATISAASGTTSLHLSSSGATYHLDGSSSGPADLRLYEDTDNGTNYVSIIAPATLASNFVMTLPAATDTFVGKATTDTLTNKTLTAGLVTADPVTALGIASKQYVDNQVISNIRLNSVESTDLHNGTALTANTWTDVTSNKNFTVNSTSSNIILSVSGSFQVLASTSSFASSRFVVDSAGTPQNLKLGGAPNGTAFGVNPITGAGDTLVTGLSAGTHTIKLQVLYGSTGGTLYLRASSQPNQEFLTTTVLEIYR